VNNKKPLGCCYSKLTLLKGWLMIRFNQVSKWYGQNQVLTDIDLIVRKGTLNILCGESGSGKTTLLSTINGLEPIQKGAIYIDDTPVITGASNLRVLRQQVGVVYQGYALFPHMTVERNVRLGLEKGLRLSKKEAILRAHSYLDKMGILEKRSAYPAELSGGQQQRVAIARSLAMQPKVLLMDEPVSALDRDNSAVVVGILRSLREEGMTLLIACHNLIALSGVADEITCMSDGRITERGSAADGFGGSDSNIMRWLSSVNQSPNEWSAP
jgi:ABC-type polar amino acid transport system ATPase subunit